MWKHKEAQSAGWKRTRGKLSQKQPRIIFTPLIFCVGITLYLRRGLTCSNLTLGVRSWCPRKLPCGKDGRIETSGHDTSVYHIIAG